MNLKPLAIVLTLVVIANFFLFVFGIINLFVFWSVIIFSAIIAYFVFPKLKEKQKQ